MSRSPSPGPSRGEKRKSVSVQEEQDEDVDRKSIIPLANKGFANTFSLDVNIFTEECDINISNFQQTVKEDPVISWSFPDRNNPESTPLSFVIRIRTGQGQNPSPGPSNGRQPPRFIWDDITGADMILVDAKNVSGRDVRVAMTVKIMGEDGSVKDSRRQQSPTVRRHNSTISMPGLGQNVRTLSSDGSLQLLIRMEVYGGFSCSSSTKKIKFEDNKSFKSLSDDVSSMLNETGFDDVQLRVGEDVVLCSKFLLCSRSSVFRAMFSHEMKESRENKVSIEEADVITVKDMKEFLYTDKVDGICLERTINLLYLAERYDVQSLSDYCRQALLTTHLIPDQAAQVAMVAEQHNMDELKRKAIRFIIQNTDRVLKTDGWKTLLSSFPSLANEVIKTLSSSAKDRKSPHERPQTDPVESFQIRFNRPMRVFEEPPRPFRIQNIVEQGPLANNPEDEFIPAFHLEPNGPNHFVADEW